MPFSRCPGAVSAARRTAGTLVAVCLLAVPTTAATASAVTAGAPAAAVVTIPTLRSGSSGAAVVRLQKLLGVPADGQFGPTTERAVLAFQRRHRLPETGVVTTTTWNALIAAARASRDGSRDASVLACPVDGPVHFTDTFGARLSTGRSEVGTTMLAAAGTPVVAIEDGVIEGASGSTSGSRSLVLRGTSGARWSYAHNDRNLVRTGQHVVKGQHIALVGSAFGSASALHFEWWPRAGSVRDPYPVVKAACG